MEFNSNSYEETLEFAKNFAADLEDGAALCLYGELGAGKTAFVQGLAKGFGVTEYITSPTFTVVNVYESGHKTLYHFDMYRLEDSSEAYEIGYEEYVYGSGISVIEWPERIDDILPDKRYNVVIEKDINKGESYRKITVEKVEK